MKKLKTGKEIRVERTRRAKMSKKETLKRMKEFPKRKEQFLATARTSEKYLRIFEQLNVELRLPLIKEFIAHNRPQIHRKHSVGGCSS